MHHEEYCCQHLNEIIDEREGSIVCTDCGLVLSNLLTSYENHLKEVNKPTDDYILEILSRLEMSYFFSHDIKKNLEKINFYFIYLKLNKITTVFITQSGSEE